MQRSKPRLFSLFAVVGLTALVLTGCGGSDQSPDTSTPGADTQAEAKAEGTTTGEDAPAETSGSGGEAVFSYSDTTYTAQLQFCSLQEGGDALFHGAAQDESGAEIGYLEGDFGGLSDIPYGEVRINLGATANLQSTDNFVGMGDSASHIVITDSSDSSLIVMGGAWDQDGTQLPTATLMVKC